MKYRFILTYKPTEGDTTYTRTCFPLHGDDLSINIDREEGEWYYTRNLDGKLVFTGDDYTWIMDQEFDGTFTLNIKESHDNGATFHDYFTGTFSRASLEIDQDNKQATLNGLKEGVEDLIKNGKNEDYDLMKLIPDSYAKEVQGKVPPALAMVDYRTAPINNSDIFCKANITGSGYKSEYQETEWNESVKIESDSKWNLLKIIGECKVTMKDTTLQSNGTYTGYFVYDNQIGPSLQYPQYNVTALTGTLTNDNGYYIILDYYIHFQNYVGYIIEQRLTLYDTSNNPIYSNLKYIGTNLTIIISPSVITFDGSEIVSSPISTIEIIFHYIRATLLTQSGGNADNVLDTGDYYKRMAAFEGSGLQIEITANTSDQPNGHRMVPGSDEYGGTPQYFAPPDTTNNWIPLAENNWNYASMWYTIQPSVTNGLTDPNKFGSFRWTRCWTIGCCIMHLLKRITNDKVVFSESTSYSQFLYGNPNPVEGHEPFQWLVTQKSNVMHPAASGAARCPVRLNWFLELLRNAFNCYYWFERRDDGRYDFRIEHVEYFRRGGTYTPNTQDDPPLDLTRLKPYRNFLRNGQPAKRYADQTNRYTFDLDGMVEKYTYSWQGDGGSDDFKGNPMYFRAGWIEKGSSDDRQVDNIFADLGWLMLNANTDTESSKNYDGLFIFGGYQPFDTTQWKENEPATQQYITVDNTDAWLSIPQGRYVNLERYDTDSGTAMSVATYPGTGTPTHIPVGSTGSRIIIFRLNLTANYANVVILRLHARSGNTFYVPNVTNLLRDDDSKLQNGVLAWPWLQCEYLHYDIPAKKWTYKKDEYTDGQTIVWEETGTIKMVKKQNLAVVPVPDASTEDAIVDIMGVKTGLGTGIIDNAKINLSSRNAEMTIIYDINPNS